MKRCSDCNSSSDLLGLYGDGKCDACGGDGKDHSIIGEMATGIFSPLGAEAADCYKCDGSGTCTTCGGTGEVEDDDDN